MHLRQLAQMFLYIRRTYRFLHRFWQSQKSLLQFIFYCWFNILVVHMAPQNYPPRLNLSRIAFPAEVFEVATAATAPTKLLIVAFPSWSFSRICPNVPLISCRSPVPPVGMAACPILSACASTVCA